MTAINPATGRQDCRLDTFSPAVKTLRSGTPSLKSDERDAGAERLIWTCVTAVKIDVAVDAFTPRNV